MRTARAVRRDSDAKKEPKAPGRIALPGRGGGGSFRFLKDTYTELRKVVWPTREQTTHLSMLVVVVSLAVGVALGALDGLFTEIMKRFLASGTGA